MEKGRISKWFGLFLLILKKGSLFIKPYDYAGHINELWNTNTEALKLNIENYSLSKKPKHNLLFLPLIGPLIAMISQYRLQKKWPTYVYHWPEKKLAFVRISKNAGTSIQAAFLKEQHPELDISKISVNQINEMGKLYIKPFLEPGYECFALVRNPLDRLLSCYFDQVIGREERFYFDDYIFRVIKKGMAFEDFVDVIMNIPDEMRDLHFKTQSSLIASEVGVRYFKMESDMEALNQYLGKFDLKLDFHNKNDTNFDKREFYTPELMHKVKNIYKRDFEYFGYAQNDLSLK